MKDKPFSDVKVNQIGMRLHRWQSAVIWTVQEPLMFIFFFIFGIRQFGGSAVDRVTNSWSMVVIVSPLEFCNSTESVLGSYAA